jgi:hypothetical protein
VRIRDRTKENAFNFAWMTSYDNRTTEVTRNGLVSECVTAIFPIPIDILFYLLTCMMYFKSLFENSME